MISVARTAVAIDSWCDFGRHGAPRLRPLSDTPRLSRAEAQSSLPTPGLHKTGKGPGAGSIGASVRGLPVESRQPTYSKKSAGRSRRPRVDLDFHDPT